MPSQKPALFSYLFANHGFEPIRGRDIVAAMDALPGCTLNRNNPANFFKDYTRTVRTANRNWPDDLLRQRITAVPIRGSDLATFRFQLIPNGQTQPFSDDINPSAASHVVALSTAAIPAHVRPFYTSEETSIAALDGLLGISARHLAFHHGITGLTVTHTGKKCRQSEIDIVSVGLMANRTCLVATEIKTARESFSGDQITLQQASICQMARRAGESEAISLVMRPMTHAGHTAVWISSATAMQDGIETVLDFDAGTIYTLDPPVAIL